MKNPMIYVKEGDTVSLGGIEYVCQAASPAKDCDGCDLVHTMVCFSVECAAEDRPTNDDVIFKEVLTK